MLLCKKEAIKALNLIQLYYVARNEYLNFEMIRWPQDKENADRFTAFATFIKSLESFGSNRLKRICYNFTVKLSDMFRNFLHGTKAVKIMRRLIAKKSKNQEVKKKRKLKIYE